MFNRRARLTSTLITVVWLLVVPLAAQTSVAPPLSPIKPWILDYDDTECMAERSYGDPQNPVVLGIRAMPNGETYELIVARHGRGPVYGVQHQGTVSFGGQPIRTWLLRYGLKDSSLHFQKFRVSAAQIAQARNATSMRFSVRSGSDAEFIVRAMPQVLDGLQQCVSLLRQHWNLTPDRAVLISTPAQGSITRLFSSEDYPAEAIDRSQEGTVRYLLLIDEKGAVSGCNVETTTGIPALEVMGCQAIRQRAKFKPARDSQGKAVRSGIVTPPITWKMVG